MATLTLRPLASGDLPTLDALCAGRNVHPREYERFLALEGAGGFVLADERGTLGAVTTLRYFEHGFLGPVLLSPDVEGGAGAGIALVVRAIEALRAAGVNAIEVQATEADAHVLLRLGFRVEGGTTVWERAPGAVGGDGAEGGGTREMGIGDLLDVGALDADAVGWGRKEYLAQLRDEMPASARVVESPGGDVAGYALARRARRGHHLGPLVARAGVDVAPLLRDAVARVAHEPLTALATDRAASALDALGFRRVGAFARMRAGPALDAQLGSDAVEWLLGGRLTG